MDEGKIKKFNFFTFPEGDFYGTLEMSEEDARAYCLRFDLTKEEAKP